MNTAKRARPVEEAALLAEMRRDAAPSEDKLKKVRAEVARLRECELEAGTLEERLSEVGENIRNIKEKTLVDLFDEASIDGLRLPPEGNMPAYEVALGEYYKANIPTDRQPEAYAYLRGVGSEDLIKTTFTIAFGLREAKATAQFEAMLDKADVLYAKKQGVPWNTLTAWFREEHRRKPLTPRVMEVLGASVGRVVKVVKQKEKK